MNRSPLSTLLLLLVLCTILAVNTTSRVRAEETGLVVYFGTYTSGESKGIYTSRLSPETGKLTEPVLAAATEQPSFLALHPKGKFLYAVNETTEFEGEKSGSISAFAIDPESSKLKFLNRKSTRGGAPCHLSVDKAGTTVIVANYVGGNVTSIRIEPDGSLGDTVSSIQHEGSGEDARQKSPHAHSIDLDAANRFAYVSDLGLDQIFCYAFDSETGTLSPNKRHPVTKVAPGSGPRHFAIHPSQKLAYSLNETTCSITAFTLDPGTGQLGARQTISTHPADVTAAGKSTAEIFIHPSGKFLYSSNRGHDSIAVFSIDGETGKLSLVEIEKTGGQTPRSFAIAPGGRFLLAANQSSSDVIVFKIDPETGTLEPTGHEIKVANPVCVLFAGPQDD